MPKRQWTAAELRQIERLKAKLTRQQETIEKGEDTQDTRRADRARTIAALKDLGVPRTEIEDATKANGMDGLTIVALDLAVKNMQKREAISA